MRLFNDFKTGIKNLIYWFPVIWNDRWWDFEFLLKILRHKLIKMEEEFKYGCHVGSEKDAFKIKKCRLTLDRLLKNDYYEVNLSRFGKEDYKHVVAAVDQDKDYVFKMLGKHILTWWD